MNVQLFYPLELHPGHAMNAPLSPDTLMSTHAADQAALAFASDGVQRDVWHSAFGPMLIEVRDGAAFVNGERVLSMAALREAGSS
jgi:hypothetical protein